MPSHPIVAAGKRLARRLFRKGRPQPVAGGEQAPEWYDSLYAGSASYQSPYYRSVYYFLWTILADRIRAGGLRRVLEIGCGPGQFAAFLHDQGLIDQYLGLDFSPRAIEMARRNVPRGQFVVGDARTTTVHHEFDHDVVVCTEVLEHVEDDTAILGRFTPGKRCLVTVPSFAHPSHVRCFADGAAVAERYGPYFERFDVMTLISPNSREGDFDYFYLGDGVRNRHQPC